MNIKLRLIMEKWSQFIFKVIFFFQKVTIFRSLF